MQRDPLPFPLQKRYSPQTAGKFRDVIEAIALRMEPTPTQLDNLKRSYTSIGEYLMECDELRDDLVLFHAHGSRATGTLVRPVHSRAEGYDVDGVARLRREAFAKYSGDNGPARLLNAVYQPLQRYSKIHSLQITRWERCVTLGYSDGMCVDVTPVIDDPLSGVPFGESHGRVPDRQLKLFDPTNPLGLVSTFDEAAKIRAVLRDQIALDSIREAKAKSELAPLPDAAKVQGRLLSRIVQLVKVHRNVAFGAPVNGQEDISPKSVLLNALIVAAYAARAPIPHDSELDLMVDVVVHMTDYLQRERLPSGSEFWTVRNPTAPTNNLAADMNSRGRQEAFVAWHARLIAHLTEILDCIETGGLHRLLALVDSVFGPSAALAVRELEQTTQAPGIGTRSVVVGTAIGTSVSMPARGHNFYGR